MKFTKFLFENYKGISSVAIDMTDGKKPICLLGLNESGKTSILQAIETLGRLCKGKEIQNGERKSMMPKGGKNYTGIVKFQAELELSDKDRMFIQNELKSCEVTFEEDFFKGLNVCFEYKFKNLAFIEVKKSINGIYDENKESDKIDFLNKVLEESVPSIVYYEDFIFDVPESIYFGDKVNQAEDKWENEKWQSIFDDIYNRVGEQGSGGFKKNVDEWLVDHEGDSDIVDRRLLWMSNELDNEITKKWKDIFKNSSSFKSIEIKKEQEAEYKIWIKSENEQFRVSERSKGFRWFFTFLILTEIRKSRGENTLFLLDEPASNLHASAQERIKDVLKKLCDNSQVIYSTHSPYLLDYNNLDRTYLTKNSNNTKEYGTPKITCFLCSETSEEGGSSGRDNLEKHLKPLLDHIAFSLPKIISEDEEAKNQLKQTWANIKDTLKKLKPFANNPIIWKIIDRLL